MSSSLLKTDAKPGGQVTRDDPGDDPGDDPADPTPYRTALLKRLEGKHVGKQRMMHDDHSFSLI
jgi:hypothetical protein